MNVKISENTKFLTNRQQNPTEDLKNEPRGSLKPSNAIKTSLILCMIMRSYHSRDVSNNRSLIKRSFERLRIEHSNSTAKQLPEKSVKFFRQFTLCISDPGLSKVVYALSDPSEANEVFRKIRIFWMFLFNTQRKKNNKNHS